MASEHHDRSRSNDAVGSTPVTVHGLLHVSDRARDGANYRGTSAGARIDAYLRMALRLARGVRRQLGTRLILLTNRAAYLSERVAALAPVDGHDAMSLVELEFADRFPDAAGFHSATHKVLLFDYFARQPGYSLLVDLDVICRPVEQDVLGEICGAGMATVYDISEQVFPAYGYTRIREDMVKFGYRDAVFSWYGGEFIGGRADFFGALRDLADEVIPVYAKVYESLHHQGVHQSPDTRKGARRRV
jgi:hypothetical protein